MFEICPNCRRSGFTGIKTDQGVFCSWECRDFFDHPDFCAKCLAETLLLPAGHTTTVNGTGFILFGRKNQCPTCHSIIKTLFLTVFWIPVFPFQKYRVKYTRRSNYLSRRIGTSYKIGDANELMEIAASLEDVDKTAAAASYLEIARLFPNTRFAKEAENNAKILTKSDPPKQPT
jgi:hypothetical protein